jgi:hypothetical protein
VPLETTFSVDPYTGLIGVFSQMSEGVVLLQVLFIRSRFIHSLSEHFPAPEKAKFEKQIFRAAIRIAASSNELLGEVEKSFLKPFQSQFFYKKSHDSAPYLIANAIEPLPDPYPIPSIINRTSHQKGMLLNIDELAHFIHLPSPKEPGFKILRSLLTRVKAPKLATEKILITLGVNEYQGKTVPVGIPKELLFKHVAILGSTGAGKTTLMSQILRAGFGLGYGIVFIDLKGTGAKDFLKLVPENKSNDVIYLDFGNAEYPPGLNLLWAASEKEIEELSAHLVDIFKRLFSESWGQQMERLLRQAVRTLMITPGQKTLKDLSKLLLDENYRKQLAAQVKDSDLQRFWKDDFPKLPKIAIFPILNKLSPFLDIPQVRNIVCQPRSIDFQQIMDEGKILIINLAKGGIGDSQAILLASYILARLQMCVMGRVKKSESELKPAMLLVDEFHNLGGFGSDKYSIESLFAEARQFKVSFITATQSLSRLRREVARDLLVNARTLICLNSAYDEAKMVEPELGMFRAEDITNLKVGQAIVRMDRANETFNFSFPEMKIPAKSFAEKITTVSRERYCKPRAEVESMISEDSVPISGEDTQELKRDEKQFLEFIIENPDKSVTEVYKSLSFGVWRGNRIREALKGRNLINEIETRLGKGKTLAKFLIPTFEALRLLGRESYGGRGGSVHRRVQQLVKEQAELKGFTVYCEQKIEGGIVDVHLEKGNERFAVEISIVPKLNREIENISKCLSSGYNKVFCLFFDSNALLNLEQKSKQIWSDSEQAKLVFLPLSKFSGYF